MNVDIVRHWSFPVVRQSYEEKDTILYALALGYGSQPTDPGELAFVYEKGLKALPTMATTLCHPGLWMTDPRTAIDFKKVVNGEQRLVMHAPLPVKGKLRGVARVKDIVDKGIDKGAQVVWERQLFDDETGQLLATVEQVTMCRGDGGFEQAKAMPADKAARVASSASAVQQREPDCAIEVATLPQAALIYRLSADLNPLHADPVVARAAGFDRPILHGLATFGVAARALVAGCCGNEPSRLLELGARFSAPVFPGETLRADIWREGEAVQYRCVAVERDVTVISNGTARVAAA
jgi:acyl dehydratase